MSVQRHALVAILAAVVFVTTAPSFGQEITGNLEGRILDESGTPVASVNVRVTGSSLQGTRSTTSNADGYVRILALPIGVYDVRVSHDSYQQLAYNDVTVQLGKTTKLPETRLTSRVNDMETVIVVGRTLVIDPISTTTGYNLTGDELVGLPVDRDYRSAALLLPHVTDSYRPDGLNYAGATGMENKYFIDGLEVTHPWNGVSGMNLPYNFVHELQVKTGAYEAEYRSALGAILNVVSPSGSNEFHGQVFGFFTDNSISEGKRQATFEPEPGGFAQYDVGLNVGGPIVRDRLWFSAAYNPQFQREDVDMPGVSVFEDKITRHIFAGKLAWQATPQTSVTMTVLGDPTKRDAIGDIGLGVGVVDSLVNPDPWLSELSGGNLAFLLNGTQVVTDEALIEASVSFLETRDKRSASTERGANEVFFFDRSDRTTRILSGGVARRSDNRSRQIAVDVKGSWFLGRHMLKAGAAYEDNRYESDDAYEYIRFGPALRIFDDPPPGNVYQVFSQTVRGAVSTRIPSVFAQDSWQVLERLRLNVGLRWDGQYLIDSNGDVAQKILDQYQPRVGFIYEPGAVGSQRIFGSFGRFYHEIPTMLPSQNHNAEFVGSSSLFECDPRTEPCDPSRVISRVNSIQDEVDGLEGQYFDEFSLGYERLAFGNLKLGVRATYRTLRQAIDDLFITGTDSILVGNPARGLFSDFPNVKREYVGLEVTAQKSPSATSNLIASYVLSRNYGNYPGLFASNRGNQGILGAPNRATWDRVGDIAEGLLPNDRTHVFKLSGWYRFDFGLSAGGFFVSQSGTPFSEKLAEPPKEPGTAGRTPWLWDLNFRFGYELPWRTRGQWNQRLLLDILHVGNPRETVLVNQAGVIGDPDFGRAIAFQPPMAVRLGTAFAF